jgi:Tfp pilus assembly protein PilV
MGMVLDALAKAGRRVSVRVRKRDTRGINRACSPSGNIQMQTSAKHKLLHGARALAGFTIVEAMIASGVMLIFVMVCMSALVFDEAAVFKSKEEALVMDFMNHYLENLKALPFADVTPGYPINTLYDGVNGAPTITIPTNGALVDLTSTNYQTFAPDLLWLNGSSPILGVTFDQNYSNSVLHDVHIGLTVTWTAPLQKGGVMQMESDLIRTFNQ